MENNELIEKIMKGEATQDELNEMFSKVQEVAPKNYKIDIKFTNESNNPDPVYAKEGDSGFDLRANLEESVTLGSLERAIIPTGLKFDFPKNMEGQVRSRSGLSSKNGVCVLNSPGTVDSSYTGEIKVILVNLSKDEFTVNHGDRIAQMVISVVHNDSIINLNKVEEITKVTDRGSSGFGSTGVG